MVVVKRGLVLCQVQCSFVGRLGEKKQTHTTPTKPRPNELHDTAAIDLHNRSKVSLFSKSSII